MVAVCCSRSHGRAATLAEDRGSAGARAVYTARMELYDQLTAGRTRFVRIDELCRRAAELRPDLLPSEAELAAEDRRALRDKLGVEKKQGAFLAELLGDAEAGAHLCHAMLLPRADSAERLAEYERTGVLELPGASVHRVGKASVVTTRNPRFLNAEDATTIDGFEIAIDVATLDARSEICVMRGGVVDHPK